jgi:hypothetical protein
MEETIYDAAERFASDFIENDLRKRKVIIIYSPTALEIGAKSTKWALKGKPWPLASHIIKETTIDAWARYGYPSVSGNDVLNAQANGWKFYEIAID